MEYEIFEKDKKGKVRLALEYNDDREVRVVVVDEMGERQNRGILVTFTLNGRLYRNSGINPDFGFELDEAGALEEELR